MDAFLREHATLLVGIGSAVGGALITFLVGWLLRKREYDLRLWEKLVERRIDAHEQLIGVAIEMRVMVGTGAVEDDGEVQRAPQVLMSKDEFERWFTRAVRAAVGASTWLATDAKREAGYLQDYLVTLYMHLQGIPNNLYLTVGTFIRQDFIDASARLERAAFDFFKKDAHRLRIGNLDEWHKHPRKVTEQRLSDTQLLAGEAEWRQAVEKALQACGS